jgi:hypothetical protein
MRNARSNVVSMPKRTDATPAPVPAPNPPPFFRAGEPIIESGVYRVFHAGHRVSHEVTLIKNEAFPECLKCGKDVHYELLRTAPSLDQDHGFNVRLYKVPHLVDEAS